MDSGVPNAECERNQAEKVRDAISHPLASMTTEPQEWLNQLPLFSDSQSQFQRIQVEVQGICLDESVYFSEKASFRPSNKCVLHKCNMKTQSYNKFQTNVEGYALAVYQSKVVMIGGNVPSSQNHGFWAPSGYPEYPISVFDDDCGLEERLKSALDKVPQESRYVYEIGKNAYAVGEGDLLIVIGGEGTRQLSSTCSNQELMKGFYGQNWSQLLSNNQEYVRVFDGQNWSYGVIDITCTTGSRYPIFLRRCRQIALLVYQSHIFMTAYDNNTNQTLFYYISLKCFRNQLDPKVPLSWNQLEDVPDCTHCTNLSVLGNQLVTVGMVDGGFRMYAYLLSSSKWIVVHEFQALIRFTGIIGLQSSSSPSDQVEALIVGAHKKLTRIYKLTAASQPYNLDGEVQFLALVKLEELTNIPVLTVIEKNAEEFKDTAGFNLLHFGGRRKVRVAYEYIESWKKDKVRYYEPTWTGLFAVLRQIGLNSLATSIDNILRETSPVIEQLVESKDPETAMDMLVKLKEALTELSKSEPSDSEPSDLQRGVNACASKCDKVLQKFKIEKTDTERELESRKATIEQLTSELREYIHDQPPGAKCGHIDASDGKDDSPIPKLRDLLKELYKVAAKWHNLGIMLEIDDGELSKVKSDNAGNSDDCLREMLKIWLKKVDPKPSWSSMAEALEVLGEESVAEHIKKTYCSTR